jgi:hypothetical protein
MLRLREDNESLVVKSTWENRECLMTLEPETYFLTDHYRAYPWVLACLPLLRVRCPGLSKAPGAKPPPRRC